jgi:gamma-glutamyl-gamma-aminobutyrate hydrolase PuuD
MQLFNVYHGGTLIYDIPSVTQISGHAKIQGIHFSYYFFGIEDKVQQK